MEKEKPKNDRLEKSNLKIFRVFSKQLGDLIKNETERLNLNRHEMAEYLAFMTGVSQHTAYLRLLDLHRRPYNITIKTVVAVLNTFGYELKIVKKRKS